MTQVLEVGRQIRAGGRPEPVVQLQEPQHHPVAQSVGLLGRQFHVVQHDILVQRCVTEEHVDELPGVIRNGLRREPDAHFKQARLLLGDRLDAADDFVPHEIVGDGRDRHFDALLDRDCARARLDRPSIAADAVNRLHAGMRDHHLTIVGSPTRRRALR